MKKYGQNDPSLENEARRRAAMRERDEALEKTGEKKAPPDEKEQKKKRKNKQIVLQTTPEGASFFSNKRNIVRLVVFVLALAAAIYFITNAVRMMIEKEPGWYEIEAEVDKDVPYYSSGVEFKYELKGSGGDNAALYKSVKTSYESSLKAVYKLTDAERTYDGVVNVASINARPGERVEVGEALFAILSDAIERAGNGYLPLDGVFAHMRDLLVYSESAAEVDPAVDSDFAAMLVEYSEIFFGLETELSPSDLLNPILSETDDGGRRLVGRGSQITLYPETREVKLEVSSKLTEFLGKYEMDGCPILDLDTLRRAYILDAVARDIERQGFSDGYLMSDDGLTVLLSGMDESEICLFSLVGEDGDQSAVSATYRESGGGAFASLRVFALYEGESGFYTLSPDGGTIFRHKYMRDFNDGGAVLSVLAGSDAGDVVGAARLALEMLAQPDEANARSLAKDGGLAVIFETKDGRGALLSTAKDGVSVNTEAGFAAKYIG